MGMSLPAALLGRFDLTNPAFIADPYPVLAELREATPIFYNERSNQWVITRFSDVYETLRDRRLGRVYTHRYTHAEFGRPEPDPRWATFEEHERWSLLQLEPPDHTRIRRLIAKVFTPRAVSSLRPAMEALADELLAPCVEARRFDVLSDYAQPFSVAVICSLLGVPRADTRHLLDWSHAIVKMYELEKTDAQQEAATRAAGDFMAYTRELIALKRRQPDGLLVAELAAVEDEGERLSDPEIISTVIVLLNAGHEATVNTVGNGLRAFLLHPAEWERVVDGRVEPRVAVEEMIRWDAPLQLFERWVLDEHVEIAGQPVAVGDEVAMLFGSANRDPRRFAEPDHFDAGRGDTAHIGFGGGIHFCVGAPLARQELDVSVGALARHTPRLSRAAEPHYQPAFVIRGLTSLDVEVVR
jgi:cytochrome P450